MNFSRLLSVVVLAVVALVGSASTANAHPVGEVVCDDPMLARSESCPGKVETRTYVGPLGQQVAVFCIDDVAAYGARYDIVGEILFPGISGNPPCDDALSTLPGYSQVTNTSPTEGWTINAWTGDVSICHDGVLTTVLAPSPPEPPEWITSGAGICESRVP